MLSSKKTLQNNVSTPAKPGFRVLSQLLVSEWKVQQISFWFKLNELSGADIQIIRRRLESEVSADTSRRMAPFIVPDARLLKVRASSSSVRLRTAKKGHQT